MRHVVLQAEALPVCAGGDPCVSLEERAKKNDILITDGITDLLHSAIVAFQQVLGGSNSQLLQVDQRAISGGLLKAANEIAQAHASTPGRGVEREASVKVLVQPLLRAGDGVITMLGF